RSMLDSITCPFCKMTSHNRNDVENAYCGNCNVFHGEVGRELKASELEPGTVVVVTKEGRKTAMTLWIKEVGQVGIVCYLGELNLYSVFSRMGRDREELHDDNGRLHVFQYLGGDAPTSGVAKA